MFGMITIGIMRGLLWGAGGGEGGGGGRGDFTWLDRCMHLW